uniref:Spermatogenesis-associated protein 2 PUB-like domain-containing protein n=1 Tax=Lates calcarifer TaxID=8187 RepID=A0A4W6BMR0_LATCA
MKDGTGAGEQAEVSRQELYEDYVNCYLHQCVEARPCHDRRLLKKAAQYLLREPEPRDTFTVFPFYQAVGENCEPMSTNCRKHLCAFIKATELLETLCVNLFLQPWKKEFKTLKTFTGPFVYCLQPALSSPTIQSVLASIGYLPHTDTPQRLCEDASPDRAILVGFELLLARVECHHLLELLEKDHQRAVPLYSDTRLAVNPQSKPRKGHLISADQSIMEMQRTYPDLAFRGRPLVPDKQANSSRSSSKTVHTASDNYSDDSKAVELPKRDCIKGTKAAPADSKNDGSKADEVLGDNGRSSGANDGNSGGNTTPGNTTSSSFSNNNGSRVDDELSGPQAISLHITLRAGHKAEQGLKPGESQPTTEPTAWMQQQAPAGNTHTHTHSDSSEFGSLP